MILFNPTRQKRFESHIGKRFHRLVVLDIIDRYWDGKQYRPIMLCVCDCGSKINIRLNDLITNHTKSCKCLQVEKVISKNLTHGMSHTKVYKAYSGAFDRCNNPNAEHYSNYGGRGIEFRFDSFEEWYEELGDPTTNKHTVDRKNVNGHYEVGNIRWATWSIQNKNKRIHL